ncbi:MAG TPA: TraR/DksA C4-type zinc finger protein [Ferruginibacter sp.]|jgi:RNA polymerase-binding transcription factor DksA|nr:TraR/DksA C4-type zinc finger protein [Ferruginibacter sp.]
MATKKKVVKPAAKKAVKPVKKAAPAKKAPAKKPAAKAKPAPKKPAPKKAAPAKKPVAAKKIAKPAPKKVVPAKKAVPAKPAPVAKKVAAKVIVKPVVKPMTKKVEEKKPAAKVIEKTPTKPFPKNAKDIKVLPPKPVVIPKYSTKTVRKYQPEFTKSVLDQAAPDPGAPSQRYSDPELAEFKELIQRKLEAAKKELSYLHGLITRKDEMGGDETDNRYMTMEDGSLSMEREQLSQMASRQITFIDHLEKAIMRIENKTYGICRVTGRLIDKARLRAVPHATLSIEAKMGGMK